MLSPRHLLSISSIIVIIAVALCLGLSHLPEQAKGDGENTAPGIKSYKVTPSTGNTRVEFLFTATYTDADNDAPRYMRVVIDDKDYKMRAVDQDDDNYTDGKVYYYRMDFERHATVYFYFEAGDDEHDVKSDVKTLEVQEIFQWHLDIAIVFALYLIPTIWVAHVAHKMSKSLESIEQAITNGGSLAAGESAESACKRVAGNLNTDVEKSDKIDMREPGEVD